jgi:hypothetical protein
MIQRIKCFFGRHQIDNLGGGSWNYCINCGKVWQESYVVPGYLIYRGRLKDKHKQGNRYYWN